MRMGEGVEWSLHCLLTLGWLESDEPVPTAKLAAVFELPPAYLNKRLQALVRAGVLSSTPGAHGGFRLARSPEKITVMEVVAAIEGAEYAFRCTEIRQRGAGKGRPQDFQRQCVITTAMRKAELAWRRELASHTLADLLAAAPGVAAERTRDWFACVD
ncbi:Rrf2 family transcriptional regulator [Actinoallomurus sp. NBC_01490]|jgi:Rrf2 family protein|uniref:RrF2 family transcriptional regulator n=1 Tax=Actinoallomurus sp. NBC_01490 TaxID=2903557 RepID=UPI002E30D4FD|nr:Rrf2 family transcriptional regulator [Actinoallomurus sp. NBC_01490]